MHKLSLDGQSSSWQICKLVTCSCGLRHVGKYIKSLCFFHDHSLHSSNFSLPSKLLFCRSSIVAFRDDQVTHDYHPDMWWVTRNTMTITPEALQSTMNLPIPNSKYPKLCSGSAVFTSGKHIVLFHRFTAYGWPISAQVACHAAVVSAKIWTLTSTIVAHVVML